MELGPGAFMAKLDVKAAYHNVAIYPLDHRLLMVWRDRFFIDLVLPFIFNAVFCVA